MEARVVWAEGVLLSQQHFQQFEAYHREQYRQFAQNNGQDCWGLRQLDIDEGALLMDTFRIRALECVFPNGLYVHFSAKDPALSIQLPEPQKKTSFVYLYVASNEQIANVPGYPSPVEQPGWHSDFQSLLDRFDPNRSHDVLLAKPNLQLTFSRKTRHQCIPIAALTLNQQQKYQLNSEYIPPVTTARFPPVQKLLAQGENHISQLVGKLCVHFDQFKTYAPFLLVYYHLCLCADRFRQLLTDQAHPRQFYHLLRQAVVGVQSIYHPSGEPLMPYQHQDIAKCLNALYQALVSASRGILPDRRQRVAFTQSRPTIWLSDRFEQESLEQGQLVLRFPAALHDLSSKVKRLKVADEVSIGSRVQSAISGLPVRKLEDAELASEYNFHYQLYYVDHTHPIWQQIVRFKRVAVYVPHDLSGLSFDGIFKQVVL